MQFNDRIADEIGIRTSAGNLCACEWISPSGSALKAYCHRDARYRMEVQYGPTWWMQMPVKQMDMPYWAFKNQDHEWVRKTAAHLKRMRKAGKGLITRADLGFGGRVIPEYASEDLVLAQLNLMLFCGLILSLY